MCGIYGRWNTTGEPVAAAAVQRATTLIRHRGPDDEGYLLVDTRRGEASHLGGDDTDDRLELPHIAYAAPATADLALGFRRLSIVDLSPLGHQPMCSPDGRYWLVFNGEIYNYRELREDLRGAGHSFRSDCDSEVILAAYATWGAACLERFNGMWAFAIWDMQRQELFLARDRFGVKPLHYADTPDGIIFGSEIKSLVGPHGVPFVPNERVLYEYLAFGRQPHAQGGETFFDGVRSVPPGWYMVVRREGIQRRRYYDLRERRPAPSGRPAADRIAEFRELLTDSVRLRMHADVPLGTCLSGGLDSSAIVALVSQQLGAGDRAGVATGQKTFSAVYHQEGRFNERRHVETMVAATGADAHYVVPAPERLAEEVEDLVRFQDEPFGSTSIYAQWCVMALARQQGVTVLLDGQGADEALAGYLPFDAHVADHLRAGRFATAISELRGARDVAGVPAATTFLRAVLWTLPPMARRLVSAARVRQNAGALTTEFAGAHAGDPPVVRPRDSLADHLHEQVEGNLPELLRYEDRNSMAFNLESRVPFVDYRLMEYCFAEADDLRIRNGWTKYMLRESMRDLLPESIGWRRDKVGFETPEGDWMRVLLRARWSEWSDDLASAAYVSPEALQAAVRQSLSGGPTDRLLWRMLNVELWMRAWRGRSREAKEDARPAVA